MYDGPMNEKLAYLTDRHEQVKQLCTAQWTDKAIGNYLGVAASVIKRYRTMHHL